MAPSNPITIATSSLLRLVDEQISYHKELEQQTSRLDKMQREQNAHKRRKSGVDKGDSGSSGDEGNEAFLIKQQVCSFSTTWHSRMSMGSRLTSAPFFLTPRICSAQSYR